MGSPRGNIQLRTLHSTYSKRATTSTMRQLSLLLFLSVAMLCSSSTLRVKRDAPGCYFHGDCGTTKACSKSQCTDLCFSEDCNQEVNNARDEWSNTPLHLAAFNDSVVAMRLIETSANVDSADNNGETALHLAAGLNHLPLAKVLIENSANVDATVVSGLFRGLTPLQIAEK